MKKSVIIGFHVSFWLCYILLTMVLLGLYIKSQDSVNSNEVNPIIRVFFFAIIPSIVSYYAFYSIIFSNIQQKEFVLSAMYSIAISIISALLGTALMFAILGVESLHQSEESAITGVIFISFVSFVTGTIALVMKGFITWFEELKLKEELQQKNHDMEMALVKSQLDPHFLFNTLNNIDILILKNAEEASNYLNKLCDIMRFMLYETKADQILLAKEIEYIEKYIALQKIRTANSNYINFQVIGERKGQTIAPMVFLPFIENAFKHTTNKKLDNAIHIHIFIEKDSVQFKCKNKFNPHRKLQQGSNGLGNTLIERRLNLIYPEQYTLNVEKKQEEYSVSLTIHH